MLYRCYSRLGTADLFLAHVNKQVSEIDLIVCCVVIIVVRRKDNTRRRPTHMPKIWKTSMIDELSRLSIQMKGMHAHSQREAALRHQQTTHSVQYTTSSGRQTPHGDTATNNDAIRGAPSSSTTVNPRRIPPALYGGNFSRHGAEVVRPQLCHVG